MKFENIASPGTSPGLETAHAIQLKFARHSASPVGRVHRKFRADTLQDHRLAGRPPRQVALVDVNKLLHLFDSIVLYI